MIVMIVSGMNTGGRRRRIPRRSARATCRMTGMDIARARAKSLLSANMPPGPCMIFMPPMLRIPEMPLLIP